MGLVRIAVIGVGHLGKAHARILAGMPDVDLVGVVDVDAAQATAVAQQCGTTAHTNYDALLPLIDAAVVVVPTIHHHAVTVELLRRGIPVLVEKPLAADLVQAEEMVRLAHANNVLLQVGHIERFNPVFEALQQRSPQPRFIQCERLGPFSGRSTDIGAVLDLMIHDLDLLLALVPSAAGQVEAAGLSVLGGHEDVAQAQIRFENGCLASLRVSRVHDVPLRRMQVWGREGYACLDFAQKQLRLVQSTEELERVRECARPDAATLSSLKTDLYGRYLDVVELNCQGGDQLTRELEEFLHCVRTGARPRVRGEEGRDALALAVQILASIQEHQRQGMERMGSLSLPPAGRLFEPREGGAAA